MKRFSKELKINNKSFNTKFGTINIKDNHSLYIFGTTYISPVINKDEYSNDVYIMQKDVKYMVKKLIAESKCFSNNFMFDLDVRSSGIKYNKKSFLSFEIHLLHTNPFYKLSDITSDVSDTIQHLTENFETILLKNNFINEKKK